MIEAKLPENETARVAFLQKLRILDTPIEERFDRITRIVCRSLNVPVSAISLVDDDRQWFKSIQGLPVSETPRSVAFCSHAILESQPFIVPDATQDPRFAKNPLVTSDPNIRYYAGCPLDMGGDIRIGTLCAIDRKPRQIGEDQLAILEDLAAMVRSELQSVALSEAHKQLVDECNQAKRAALVDALTRLWNRAGGEELLEREWHISLRESTPVSIAILDIDRFKNVNDTYGHDVGDDVIRHCARTMLATLRTRDVVSRWGGEEFLMVLPGCDQYDLGTALDRVLHGIRSTQVETSAGGLSITASIGGVTVTPTLLDQKEDFIKQADRALYMAKKNGRDRCVIDNEPIAVNA